MSHPSLGDAHFLYHLENLIQPMSIPLDETSLLHLYYAIFINDPIQRKTYGRENLFQIGGRRDDRESIAVL